MVCAERRVGTIMIMNEIANAVKSGNRKAETGKRISFFIPVLPLLVIFGVRFGFRKRPRAFRFGGVPGRCWPLPFAYSVSQNIPRCAYKLSRPRAEIF